MASADIPLRKLLASKTTLPRWCFGALAVIFLNLSFCYGKFRELLVDIPYQNTIETTLAANSAHYTSNVNALISDLARRIDQLSTDESTLQTVALPENNASQWANNARVLDTPGPRQRWLFDARTNIREARQLYLLGVNETPFPLAENFVAEAQYLSALKGEKPLPKAAKTEGWNIYFARPLVSAGEIVGVLLVAVDPDALGASIVGNHPLEGRLQLTQQVENFPKAAFFSVGSGWRDEYSINLPTSIPGWELRFTGGEQLLQGIKPPVTLFYLAFSVLCLVSIGLAYLILRKNLVLAEVARHKASKINPLDDLFTEKFQRKPQQQGGVTPQRPVVATGVSPKKPPAAQAPLLPGHVFRDYDIRGKAGTEITDTFATALGQVLGRRQLANAQLHEACLVVCADGRNSSPALKRALIAGIVASGCNVVDIGEAPTPVMNFALVTLNRCAAGVMVTASHNPKEDNGFKIIAGGHVLSSGEIQQLYTDMQNQQFVADSQPGTVEKIDIHQQYLNRVADDVLPASGLTVVIDCGNGIAGAIAPQLLRRIGCDVIELHTRVDGNFPHHDPDPTVPDNLAELIETVRQNKADIGLGFDGDGDRLVAVSATGSIIWPDELLMIFARDIVTRNPGVDIVFDVKSTRRLWNLVTSYGGRPLMWKTGHAHIRNKVKETGAPVGGEYSGHIFFNDRWYGFDDGLYAAARLLEILTLREQSLDDIVAGFPASFSTAEIKIPVAENDKQQIMDELLQRCDFGDAHLVTIDGLRVEFADGWGLVRASNTSAALTLRFEADSSSGLDAIIAKFKQQIQAVNPHIPLSF